MPDKNDEESSPSSLAEIIEESGPYELVSCGICGKTIRRDTRRNVKLFDRLPAHWADENTKCPGSDMKRKTAIDIFFLVRKRIEGENDEDN